MKLLCNILLLLIPSQLFAVSIEVATVNPEHTLVRATTKDEGAGFVWMVSSVNGFVDTQDYKTDEISSGTTFTGPKGNYQIILIVFKEDRSVANTRKITVIGDAPPIPPGPNPPNPPNPPGPEPAGTLAKQIHTWLQPVKTKVTKAHLTGLADNYEGVAAQAVAVADPMPLSAFTALTQERNTQTLGAALALEVATKTDFATGIAKYLKAKNVSTTDKAALAGLWREISTALNEVAKTW